VYPNQEHSSIGLLQTPQFSSYSSTVPSPYNKADEVTHSHPTLDFFPWHLGYEGMGVSGGMSPWYDKSTQAFTFCSPWSCLQSHFVLFSIFLLCCLFLVFLTLVKLVSSSHRVAADLLPEAGIIFPESGSLSVNSQPRSPPLRSLLYFSPKHSPFNQILSPSFHSFLNCSYWKVPHFLLVFWIASFSPLEFKVLETRHVPHLLVH
jgi:hypothetical protein